MTIPTFQPSASGTHLKFMKGNCSGGYRPGSTRLKKKKKNTWLEIESHDPIAGFVYFQEGLSYHNRVYSEILWDYKSAHLASNVLEYTCPEIPGQFPSLEWLLCCSCQNGTVPSFLFLFLVLSPLVVTPSFWCLLFGFGFGFWKIEYYFLQLMCVCLCIEECVPCPYRYPRRPQKDVRSL